MTGSQDPALGISRLKQQSVDGRGYSMKINQLLLKSKNIGRDSFTWNMAGSMLYAFQSVIILMILTRVLGLTDAGIFTIAYANANLFLTIGKYGMRSFQVSDVRRQFSFWEYARSRWITSLAMLVVSVGYVLYAGIKNAYELDKALVILCMCLMKTVDSVEDIFCGLYQQRGRLDVGAKAMTMRLIATILVFSAGLILLKNLLIALLIATVCTTALLLLLIGSSYQGFVREDKPAEWENVWLLLRLCFPLFAGQFLSFYITSAPKYAIDALLTDEAQACYGFISMPVFVIDLLNGFIFNPMMYKMSTLWEKRRIKLFLWRAVRQTGIILLITLVCIAGAWLLGIPVLSWLYNTDLTPYKTELLILLLGGGFLGLSGFMATMNTIIRRQDGLMWGYGAVALLALFCSEKAVMRFGMLGATVLYTVLMAALCVVFVGLFFVGIRKAGVKNAEQGKVKV